MTSSPVQTLSLAAALACATAGGVFFAFSTFVMSGLARLPKPQGAAAMQSINRTAVTPAFMSLLFGAALACAALVVVGVATWGDRRAVLLVAGGAVYLLGAIALTAGYHVPLNDSLAALDPQAPTTAARWTSYVSHWTAWNHVRTVSSLLAAALLFLATTA